MQRKQKLLRKLDRRSSSYLSNTKLILAPGMRLIALIVASAHVAEASPERSTLQTKRERETETETETERKVESSSRAFNGR
jgi:hypothetical protein